MVGRRGILRPGRAPMQGPIREDRWKVLRSALALVIGAGAWTAARAAGPSSQPATLPTSRPAAHGSLWGAPVQGLQARLDGPRQCEQNEILSLRWELACDSDHLPAGVDRFDRRRVTERASLTMTDVRTGRAFTVTALDPWRGPPVDEDWALVSLAGGTAVKLSLEFPLRAASPEVAPGDYDCVLTCRAKRRPAGAMGPGTRVDPARVWHGELVTGPLRIHIAPETPKSRRLFVPGGVFQDEEGRLRCRAGDVEAIDVPLRNGCFVGTRVTGEDGMEELAGGWTLGREGGDIVRGTATPLRWGRCTVEVFETGLPPGHLWFPSPGSDDYKTLWKRTFSADRP